MLTNAVEIDVNRRNTAAFIEADFEWITLTPRTQTRTTTGGYTYTEGTPRDPQKFHVSERITNAMPRTRVPGGDQREEDFTLLGLWDAVIEVHDIFTLNGGEWEVVAILQDNAYERRATVLRYGR